MLIECDCLGINVVISALVVFEIFVRLRFNLCFVS